MKTTSCGTTTGSAGPGKDGDWIKVYALGGVRATFDGKPVHKDVWNEAAHLAPAPLELYKGLPLVLGWDFGLTSACVVCQLSPRGQLRVIREYDSQGFDGGYHFNGIR